MWGAEGCGEHSATGGGRGQLQEIRKQSCELGWISDKYAKKSRPHAVYQLHESLAETLGHSEAIHSYQYSISLGTQYRNNTKSAKTFMKLEQLNILIKFQKCPKGIKVTKTYLFQPCSFFPPTYNLTPLQLSSKRKDKKLNFIKNCLKPHFHHAICQPLEMKEGKRRLTAEPVRLAAFLSVSIMD